MVTFTDIAVEEAKRLIDQQGGEDGMLRIGVETGGCSGLSYTMDIVNESKEKDLEFEYEGLKVVCDPKSYLYINGIEVDYSAHLVGGGFRFSNPNASKSCSCGTSFKV